MSDDKKQQQTKAPTGATSKARAGTVKRADGRKPTPSISKERPASSTRPMKKDSGKRSASAAESVLQSAEINVSNGRTPIQRKRPVKRTAFSDYEIQATESVRDEENSIEETKDRAVANSADQTQFSIGAEIQSAPSMSARPIDGSAYLLSNISRAAQGLGAWLQNWRKLAHPRALEVVTAGVKPGAGNTAPAASAAVGAMSNLVPEAVSRRFLKVDHDYYFLDKTPAFSDRGTKLATRGAHPEVVRSLVDIAQARGWGSVTVKGTKEFRRSAWIEAAQRGLKVVGYEPNPLDIAELANRPATNSVEKSLMREKDISTSSSLRPAVRGNAVSPPFAVQAPSSEVPLRSQAVVQDLELAQKAKAFEKNKPAYVVKKYPDLVGAYGIVEAAKTFALERLPELVREEFVGIARQHVLQKIAAGQVVQGPKVFVNHSKVAVADAPTKSSGAGSTDKVKEQPKKQIVRDR